jgi:ABC-type transport system involved in cytochrome c biogenesis permease subunit
MRERACFMKVTALLVVLLAVPASRAMPPLPTQIDMDAVRGLVTQRDGRWPPLDTVARDVVGGVTGTPYYQGHDPVLVLLGWTINPAAWRDAPLIQIRNQELRAALQLSGEKTSFSYAELITHPRLQELLGELRERPQGKKLNPLELKVSNIYEKLLTLQQVFSGQTIRLIPDPDDVGAAWRPIQMARPSESAGLAAVHAAWNDLRAAFTADDTAGFTAAAERLSTSLAALPAAHRPPPSLIATELHSNALRPFRVAWIAMVAGVVVAALGLLVRSRGTGGVAGKVLDALAVVGLLAGFLALSYGLWLRWQIAGRIPAANMFESLLFLSWGAGAFGILALIGLRDRFVPLTASAMGALALILADCLPMDRFVRPIAPVLLDTVWMSIHVPIIMVSYAVLAVAVLIAHGQIIVMAAVPRRRDLAIAIDNLHYWYAFIGSLLLLAGIITGSMWAASSWGRYWGWDPKEVWSLVAFLAYMAILHVRLDHQRTPAWVQGLGIVLAVGVFAIVGTLLGPLTPAKTLGLSGAAVAVVVFVTTRGPFATATKSILAFWLIIMTYVGVNYVLGIGLHSYGFGAGAVVKYLIRLGLADAALVAICCVLYLARRPAGPPAVVPQAGTGA